ncbi:glycosyltransferase family 4 protein [Zavarzinia compransoris]|uniref:Glycosyltransferase family 1 protein n=1 Tax=Zavarzinia compransoris TaxID=1264899 RepID=A0A317DYW7_9PROT|nr:glycosyltransferase family 1 protein [Zavarzinia compransoris]PWR18223.1 glycosyltransferase family 1 protein [Zavarzinia compransoris]TDP40884.1 glycosyltransferase involved in cell wall biosynthesis [Zavarzinia compransoris]
MTISAPAGGRTAVAFDVTRLIRRLDNPAPTGIDRVDMAYTRFLSKLPEIDLHMMTTDVVGARVLSRSMSERVLDIAASGWDPVSDASAVAEQAEILAFLEAPYGVRRPEFAERDTASTQKRGDLLRALRFDQFCGGRRLRRLFEPRDGRPPATYLHVSHSNLNKAKRFHWLSRSRGAAVFFIHDLIPLNYPEFCREDEAARHMERIETVHRHADLILVNSESTKRDLIQYFETTGREPARIEAVPLGIESEFLRPRDIRPPNPVVPYFVVVGTIEPRKNHSLLLQVWRRLVERHGARAPRLVIIGRRGWENESVFNQLERASFLDRHVVECNGMSDVTMRYLLCGACALLTPSFAEGFGLPAAEALTLGTPVIASDLETHNEVYGPYADYLDPIDGRAWLQAIEEFSDRDSPRRLNACARARMYSPPTWQGHIARVRDLLLELNAARA